MTAGCEYKTRPTTARPNWILAMLAALWFAGCGGVTSEGGQAGPSLDQAALLTASCSGCHASSGSSDGIVSLEGRNTAELQKSPMWTLRSGAMASIERQLAITISRSPVSVVFVNAVRSASLKSDSIIVLISAL